MKKKKLPLVLLVETVLKCSTEHVILIIGRGVAQFVTHKRNGPQGENHIKIS
jgi:hypothetical protein